MQKNDKNPLVSIIMPCYNHAKYVGEAIESILNQTYTNIEFIVCDNGSTDNSYEVMKQYEGKIDKIIHLDKNNPEKAGIMMRGVCTGEYIAFMTADDFWEKEKLEKQMEILKKNPQVKACFTWANEADENLVLQGEKKIFKERNRDRYQWLSRLLREGNCLAYPSAVVEWKTYCEMQKELICFSQLSDLYLWLLMLLEHEIYVIEEPLVWFRWHESGENRNMSAPNRDTLNRTNNEMPMITERIIDQMEPEVFKKTFGETFRNPEAITPEEISCEKFFWLLEVSKENKHYYQCAINYYYNHYVDGIVEALTDKYQFTKMDFKEYSAQHGIASLVEESEYFQNQYLSVLYESVSIEYEQPEQRRRIWRRKIHMSLPASFREMSGLLVACIDAIENMGISQYQSALAVIREMQRTFESLWNEFLQWDKAVDEERWIEYVSLIAGTDITQEEYAEKILPFLQETNIVLKEYCGNY